jgi:hypothetical protein
VGSIAVASVLAPGYSHRYDTISELAGPGVQYPGFMEFGFIAFGALMVPLGVALLRYLGARASTVVLFALLSAYSATVIGAGVFRDSSPWRLAGSLSAGQMHDYLALAAYGESLGIMLLTGWAVRSRKSWVPFAWYSLASALLCGGFGLLFQLEHAWGLGGLYQRGFCFTTVVWISFLAFRVSDASGRSDLLVPTRSDIRLTLTIPRSNTARARGAHGPQD